MAIIKHSISFSLLLLFQFSIAQRSFTGIYKTADDFLNGRLSHNSKGTHLKLHKLFHIESLEVKSDDSIYTYLKKDVYGYRNKKAETFRFYDGQIFPILNPTEPILIYATTSGTGMKNSPFIEQFYFSRSASSAILALSMRNLEKAFAEDLKFLHMLSIYFRSGDALSEYDVLHHTYQLNRLHQISQQNN